MGKTSQKKIGRRGEFTPHGGEHLLEKACEGYHGNGYEKLGDRIWPSPGSRALMEDVMVREAGLHAYIAAMNAYLIEQFRILANDKRTWWDRSIAAFELDPNITWQWSISGKCIEPVPPKDKPSATTNGG